jgi:DNA polymerase
MSSEPDLYDLVRQLKTELEWASRTGIVVEQKVFTGATSSLPQISLQQPEPALVSLGRQSLQEVREDLGDCTRCKLHSQGRTQIVFGVGSPTAELMFIGEGPGADEDRLGEPFVGKAGQLLTKIIEAGMGMQRGEVYIANIVKCRPPQNRDPEPDEVEACEPFLKAQIRSIGPKVIIALGKYAAQTLLRTQTPITRLRGRWNEYDGIAVMPTYHPAYLLRNPAEKRAVWEDIQEVLKRMGRTLPERGARD